MKIGIMQPYLFPYVGYFQLINSVDIFVACNDVQYIKQGWINRNRVLINGEPHMFIFSLKKGKQSLKINERYFSYKFEEEKDKFLKTLKSSYRNSPYYKNIMPLVLDILNYTSHKDISCFIYNSLKIICDYIGIDTLFVKSSDIVKNEKLKCQDKVIDMVKMLGGDVYINSIGGINLYSKEVFKKEGIELYFIKTHDFTYKQYGDDFIPNLSIIDLLMFNSKIEVKNLLDEYDLI